MNHQVKTGEPCPHTGFYRCQQNHSVAMAVGHVMPHCRQCAPHAPHAPVTWNFYEKEIEALHLKPATHHKTV
jgi:hypothetical protein